MPTKSSTSSVLKWPDAGTVHSGLERWAQALAATDGSVIAIGFFGSYARGDAGVGSDLDVVLVVSDSEVPWESRASSWNTTSLPVPVDLLVYTRREWDALDRDSRFGRMLAEETRWVSRASAWPTEHAE